MRAATFRSSKTCVQSQQAFQEMRDMDFLKKQPNLCAVSHSRHSDYQRRKTPTYPRIEQRTRPHCKSGFSNAVYSRSKTAMNEIEANPTSGRRFSLQNFQSRSSQHDHLAKDARSDSAAVRTKPQTQRLPLLTRNPSRRRKKGGSTVSMVARKRTSDPFEQLIN